MAQQDLPIKTIESSDLARPAAVFSHATISDRLVFVSGQAGVDFATGKIETDFGKQARQAFENLKTVLEAAGSDLSHTTKVVVWLKRPEDFDQLNAIWKEYFSKKFSGPFCSGGKSTEAGIPPFHRGNRSTQIRIFEFGLLS